MESAHKADYKSAISRAGATVPGALVQNFSGISIIIILA